MTNSTQAGPRDAATELERLRAAVEFCRSRLKRDFYKETLDKILSGEKDHSILNPDHTPVVLSTVSEDAPDTSPIISKIRTAQEVFFSTVDPTVFFNGRPMPAGTTLLHRVCGNDPDKFVEACRIVELFVTEAMS